MKARTAYLRSFTARLNRSQCESLVESIQDVSGCVEGTWLYTKGELFLQVSSQVAVDKVDQAFHVLVGFGGYHQKVVLPSRATSLWPLTELLSKIPASVK